MYIGEINLQNSYAVSRFADHLIDILKTACRKNLRQTEILNRIHIALQIAGMAIRIVKPQQIQYFEYNI